MVGLLMGLGLGLGAGGGTPPAPSYPQFLATDKLMTLGDSRKGQGIVGASPGTLIQYNTSVGPLETLLSLHPCMAMEQWPADTQTRDTPYSIMWTDGANMGISGSPWTKHAALVPTVIARGAKACVYDGTPNGLVDASAPAGVRDQILTPLVNAGVFLVLGDLIPIMAGSGLDPGTAQYVAARTAYGDMVRAFVAAVGPTKAIYMDHTAWCPVDANGYGTDGTLYRDGVHFNTKGTLLEAEARWTQVFSKITAAGNNRLLGLYTGVTNKLPNPTLSGTGGTRTGNISYATSLSVPNNWRVSPSGTLGSTATAGLEANAETGGQSLVLTITSANTAPVAVGTGSISGTTFSVSAVSTGAVEIGARLDLPGILPGTIIISGSGSTWTVNKSQTVASGTFNAYRIKEGINFAPSSGVSTGAVVDTSLAGLYSAAMYQVRLSDHPGWIPPQLLLNDNTVTGNIRAGNYWQVLYNDGKSDTKGRTWWVYANAVYNDPSTPATTGFRWNGQIFFDPTIIPVGATAKIDRVWAGVVGDPKPRYNA